MLILGVVLFFFLGLGFFEFFFKISEMMHFLLLSPMAGG